MVDEALLEADEKMERAIVACREGMATLRTGRASADQFAKISIDYYGAQTPITQVATFQSPEARMILVSPYDVTALEQVEKAIRDSDLGVNPTNDGKLIRVVFPDLTEERRKEFVKVAHTKAEDAKISIRNARRAAKEQIQKLVKDGDIGEDDGHRAEKQLDDSTAAHTAQVDEILKSKESELLEI